ncbi:MAG: carboxypeptidase-like regulatory domain-containing protein [Prevotella sp.]|nr:carboxypeptidase-like regulatory domain-containing protein [Prevotella sp.]MBO5062683.1 carboxypeptidase-like regulatory domain-containing protein [Prevotella sp.]MBO5205823.1 carboxypeptidase-like regulatory domain-containing protein [Prevotella sp.]
MRILIVYLFGLLPLIATAQVNVSGKVVDRTANEPLAGASVIVKGADGKIKKFASTKADGAFTMQVASVNGCRLEVAMMGFVKQSLPLDGASFPLTVYMEEGSTVLKEVTVKADRIREQGDTITYNVGSFAQAQDRSIGDVLKRMPGIDVAKNGKIQYQGEDINKFYIEGSDLLGGKYGIATNGISHNDVGAVEVMENHQPMQVLSGISFSDKAAINLKLKNKAKATWSFHGDAGGGWSWQPEGAIWDGELFAMAAMAGFQNITTLRTNNTGEDLASSNTDFFAERRGTGLSKYVSIGLPDAPSLDSKRTLFNRSFFVSTNNLWKLKNGELKANIDYSFDRLAANASNITTYFLDDGNRVITENRDGTEHEHSLSGKLIYESNKKTAFINNTLQTNINWNDISLSTTGSIPNTQNADLPDYYVSNKFRMIKRFKGKHLVTFESRNEWESLPQTLNLDVNGSTYRQHVGDHAFYTQESAAYAFMLKGITVSLEGGIKGYWRSMNSDLPDMPEQLPGITENVVHTNSFTVYATPKLEYWIKRINLTLNLPVSFAHYSFDKAIANRDEVYFSPSLSFNWKPNNRFSGTIRGGMGRSPMNLNLIHPGLIMTDYRTLKSGVDNFYNSSSQNVSASFNYKHTRHGLFANGMVMHSWSHLPYTLAQQLYGDYAVYSYADADNDGKTLMVYGSIGKTLDFMRGSCNINGSFNRNESQLLSQLQSVQSVSTGWSIGGKVNGSPWRWFSFDYAISYSDSRLTMNGTSAPWLLSMKNELNLSFIPHTKWQWQIGGEHYYNELTEGEYKNIMMLDTKLIFKPTKSIELAASLTNILNKTQYNYTTYSQLSSFESQRQLRGRQLLLSLTLRK